MTAYRERVLACARGGTYKYFLDREDVQGAWERLAASLGPIVSVTATSTIQIETPALIVRSTHLGNPITVFRKRACRREAIDTFHRLIGYVGDDGAPFGG